MDVYKNLKKSTKAGLIISLVLIAIGLVLGIYSLAVGFSGRNIGIQLHIVIVLIEYLLVAFYALWGYKKPHGNILRYTMFAFGFLCMYKFFVPGKPVTANIEYIANACIVLAALLIVYMSGRLNKIDKNKIIMIVVGILLVANIILMRLTRETFSFGSFVRSLSLPVCWAALCSAYTARFEAHKAAGLADKADAKEN